MQGFKTFVLLAVVVALLGLARAAPAENEPTGLEQLAELASTEQLPAMLVRPGLAELSEAARRCTASACRSACRALGWNNGVCLDAVWCMCFN
ncbi:hypothetical protein MSG28_012046 [Choristoneura fumiferana]|uniref:Uncharacterized protein n=1 Tax=Choristoneura fumiferana TaxID=7141 RepID=A0ACC0KND0_CHOFU|nr:hypothetical protein MSG28_012046 [Choristoneura fumiferana]